MSSKSIQKVVSRQMPTTVDSEKSEPLITDIGLHYLAKNGRVEYTESEERKIRWKIDLCVLSIVSCFV